MGREYSLSRLKKLHIGIIKTMTKQLEESCHHARGLSVRMTALRQAMINLEAIKLLEESKIKPLRVSQVDNIIDKARLRASRLQSKVTA